MRDRGVRDEAKSIPWASASPSLPPSLWLTSQCSDKGPKEERSGENVKLALGTKYRGNEYEGER